MAFGLKSIGEAIVEKVAEVKEARAEQISKVASSLKEAGKKVDKDVALAMISPAAYFGKKAYDNKEDIAKVVGEGVLSASIVPIKREDRDNVAKAVGKGALAVGIAPAVVAGKVARDTVKVGVGANKIGTVVALGPVGIGLNKMSETFADKIRNVIDKRKDNDKSMRFGTVGVAGATIGKFAEKFGFEKRDKDEPKVAGSLLSSVKEVAEKISDERACDHDTNQPEAVGLVGAAGKAVETVAEKLGFEMCD